MIGNIKKVVFMTKKEFQDFNILQNLINNRMVFKQKGYKSSEFYSTRNKKVLFEHLTKNYKIENPFNSIEEFWYCISHNDFPTEHKCIICGEQVPFTMVYRKTCSKKCKSEIRRMNYVKEKIKISWKNKSPESIRIWKTKLKESWNDEKIKRMQEKRISTCLKKYNSRGANPNKVSSSLLNKTNEEKRIWMENVRKTKLERYGNPNFTNRNKFVQTCLEKYGCEHPNQSEEVKEKIKNTCLRKYGKNRKSIVEKVEKTSLKRYGVKYWVQNLKLREEKLSKFSRYKFDNIFFDSKPELAFYIYCKDNDINIKRETKKFSYIKDGVEHFIIPDFEINGVFVEIKGDHLLKCMSDEKLNCFNENNIRIISTKEYQKYLKYVKERYGSKWYEDYCYAKTIA